MINGLERTTTLNNGTKMPWVGVGTFKIPDGPEVEKTVSSALDIGYRHIDTATYYGNERGVGKVINDSMLERDDVFITTKLWTTDMGFDKAFKAFDQSLDLLDMDYVDLYLVHWPKKGLIKDTWSALERIYETGRARAIGVSNFQIHHLEELLEGADIVPAVNQIEYHPYLNQRDVREFCEEHKIQVVGWSPLIRGKIVNNPSISAISKKYGKTPAQIALRWALQHDVVVIPKTVHEERLRENANVFDFVLADEDMEIIDALDGGTRIGPHPDHVDF
ncbi:aldo/keto reductase [archaeon]|nr:MAG: aldo/keto reductase [archaeon]